MKCLVMQLSLYPSLVLPLSQQQDSSSVCTAHLQQQIAVSQFLGETQLRMLQLPTMCFTFHVII
jgi:hypothetical protein